MKAILDAGPLIAAWNADDQHHRWAIDLFKRFSGPFYTSEAVLCEVAHMTGRDASIMEGVQSGRLIVGCTITEDANAIQRVLESYDFADMADSSIVAISEKWPRLPILTTDNRHFKSYRREDKSAPPLETP